MIFDVLRTVRTGAYRLAGPFDRVRLRMTGRDHLPPLWLRRHTGAVRHFESAARETAQLLDRLGLVRASDRVLDVGCGAGAMVPEVARRIGPGGRYLGFDVHAASIRWCRKRHANDPRLSFAVAAVASAYGSGSGPSAASYVFPMEDGQADFILAKSVFTHLLEPEARQYLRQIRRALKPGRAAVITAFLFDADSPSADGARRAFPFTDAAGLVRWRSKARPEAAVAYEHAFFSRMVQGSGLRIQWMSPGFFPGSDRLDGQDTLLLGH